MIFVFFVAYILVICSENLRRHCYRSEDSEETEKRINTEVTGKTEKNDSNSVCPVTSV